MPELSSLIVLVRDQIVQSELSAFAVMYWSGKIFFKPSLIKMIIPMLNFITNNYSQFNPDDLKYFFRIRKKIFKDKLDWLVRCQNDMEFDEFDNEKANYLIGKYKEKIVGGCRFIDMKNHNMCAGIFYKYFKEMKIKEGNYVELTRIFIDRDLISELGIGQIPIKLMLFLKIIMFAKHSEYEGIYAVASEKLLNCLITSGWRIDVQQRGVSEKNEYIYLIIMSVAEESISALQNKLQAKIMDQLFSGNKYN